MSLTSAFVIDERQFFDDFRDQPYRKKKAKIHEKKQQVPLVISSVIPKTENQKSVFKAFNAGKNLFLHGSAGTGKSFLAFYLTLSDILCNNNSPHKKLYIVRSVVPSRDIGFLPGKASDKSAVYEAPYHSICTELFGRSDAYDLLKKRDYVEFVTTSFLRGTTFSNCSIVIDEAQNMDAGELHTVMTRIGTNCRVIFTGDIRQNDLEQAKSKSGLRDFVKVLRKMKSFDFTNFTRDDILRSDLVKEYIITRENLEDENSIQKMNDL